MKAVRGRGLVEFSGRHCDFFRLVVSAGRHEREMARRSHANWRLGFSRRLGMAVLVVGKKFG